VVLHLLGQLRRQPRDHLLDDAGAAQPSRGGDGAAKVYALGVRHVAHVHLAPAAARRATRAKPACSASLASAASVARALPSPQASAISASASAASSRRSMMWRRASSTASAPSG